MELALQSNGVVLYYSTVCRLFLPLLHTITLIIDHGPELGIIVAMTRVSRTDNQATVIAMPPIVIIDEYVCSICMVIKFIGAFVGLVSLS